MSMPQLLQLVPSKCIHPSCALPLSQFRGCSVYLHFRCDQGHTYSWSSSNEHLDKRGNSIQSNNLLVAASCLLSGNSFSKISQMLDAYEDLFRKHVLQVKIVIIESVDSINRDGPDCPYM